jgi:diguanylate cyclase (GGDEF)-like protein
LARVEVLVVGDAPLAQRIEQALQASDHAIVVRRAENYLMALGHLGAASLPPPAAVIGRVTELDEPPDATAAAIGKLARHARLLLIADKDSEADAINAVAAGFADYLLEPIDPSALTAAIFGPSASSQSQPDRGAPGRRGQDEAIISAGQFLGDAPPSRSRVPTGTCDDSLGDVDLLDHLLAAAGPVRPLAVKLIEVHCRVDALGWADDGRQVPAGHIAVEVTLADQRFGLLHAPPPATVDLLEPWTMWLARWLAVERRLDRLWNLAVHDELTGVWSRRYLMRFLETILKRARDERFRVTVLVFDIDDFKLYNDHYGHAAGDEILCETAKLMGAVVRDQDVVARIGGDEFAVVFWDAEQPRAEHSEHPNTIRKVAQRFQHAICQHRFPKLAEGAPGTLTISGGLAGFPWDGQTAEQLLQRADEMALQSKRQGKNVITFGPGALKTCELMFPDENP